ncbi:MAG: FAD-binding protein [Anaerolineales bacterium]|nr:FAD-binding protein [Anaerolineales bacterium]
MRITSLAELQAAVRGAPRVVARGAGTKPALATPPDGVLVLDLRGLSGVLEYEPGEFTFSALAGTRVSEVESLLAENGQYLPFDPLLVERGATLGGTLAAGLSGPGRYRFGGLRDFILAVRYIDGEGALVRGGGKVVKNAAGFDLPKLMVGSLGQFGVLYELTFKVFPRPDAHVTVRAVLPTLAEALAGLLRVYAAPLDVDALDLWPAPDGSGCELWVRLGGPETVLPARAERMTALIGAGETMSGPGEAEAWRALCELAWVPDGWGLVKTPLAPGRLLALNRELPPEALRRYCAGGNLAWIALPDPRALDSTLTALSLAGLIVLGAPGRPRMGVHPGVPFEQRIKAALDPHRKFPDFNPVA